MSELITTDGTRPTLNQELLSSCIHCGLCLPACPTYLATGRETESPRGRIYLLSLWQQGELAHSEHGHSEHSHDGTSHGETSHGAHPHRLPARTAEHLESCLGCLGCQTACPSGVKYEEILNQARPYIAAERPKTLRAIMRFAFRHVLTNYALLKAMGVLLAIWQSGNGIGRRILEFVAGTRSAQWSEDESSESTEYGDKRPLSVLERLLQWEAFVPQAKPIVPLPKRAIPSNAIKGDVNFFQGCVMDVLYNHVNHAAIRLLTLIGKEVSVPKQTCCGALAFHAGEMDIATELAKKNILYFMGNGDPIVVTSAGCGAMLKHYGHLLKDDAKWHVPAEDFSKRVEDITETLAAGEFAKVPDTLSEKVAYHPACHLAHAQGVRAQPAALLEQLDKGTGKLVPLADAEHCCGSAGIYNLMNTELSLKVLDAKMASIKETGAQVVVTGNPGCLLQLEAGVKRAALNVRVCHTAELLDESFARPAVAQAERVQAETLPTDMEQCGESANTSNPDPEKS